MKQHANKCGRYGKIKQQIEQEGRDRVVEVLKGLIAASQQLAR